MSQSALTMCRIKTPSHSYIVVTVSMYKGVNMVKISAFLLKEEQ